MDPIAEYISQHRDTYTREALDRELLDKGYTKEEIEAAWASLPPADADQQAAQAGGVRRTPIGAGFTVLCIFSILIGAFLVFLTFIWFSFSSTNIRNSPALSIVGALVTVGSVAVAIGMITFGVSRLNNGWSAWRVAGLIIVVSLLWYLVIIGTCLNAPTLLRQ